MSDTPQSDLDSVAGIARVATFGIETDKAPAPELSTVRLPGTGPAHA